MPVNTQPFISVVMATYNGEIFLAQQIDSILQQSYQHFEIIICDDASQDQTQSIIERYSKADNRIQYHFNTKQLGLNKNFEKAISLAKGDYIAISDQDDIWRSDKLEKLSSLFETEDTVLVHGQSIRFSSVPPLDQKWYTKRNLLEGNNPSQLLYFNTVAGHNIIFRKQLFDNFPFIPEGIFYDWWLVMLALCYGKVATSSEILTFHRIHENNVTLGKKDEKRQTKAKAKERLRALTIFMNHLPLPHHTQKIATSLQQRLQYLNKKRFSLSLFLFLIQHTRIFFFFKKNKIPFFSTLKISYRMSWAI